MEQLQKYVNKNSIFVSEESSFLTDPRSMQYIRVIVIRN